VRIVITHRHSDHTIDLGHLGITPWIGGPDAPSEVWGRPGRGRKSTGCSGPSSSAKI
jgi:ribonuclease BN (tRNA processing enzyme)